MIYDYWLSGMVAIFVTALLFFTMTSPILSMFGSFSVIGNFTNSALNESYHGSLDNTNRMWNMWPIAAGVVIFLVMLVATADEETNYRRI